MVFKIIRCVFILWITTVCFDGNIYAQDPHFSQFFSSPLTLNPALTGKFDGSFRVGGNYRNQWPTLDNLYRTYSVSADFKILENKIPEGDIWGIGIMAMKDEAGGNILTNNYAGITTSYHRSLDEDGKQQFGLGFQLTYGQKKLDNTNLQYEDMLTPFGFTNVTAEIFQANQLHLNYWDVAAGIMYSGSTSERNSYYGGISIYHINRPEETFKGGSWYLSPRFTVHGGGFFPISDLLTFHGSGIYQRQGGMDEMVFGGAISAPLGEWTSANSNIYLGTWVRWKDALIPYLGLEYGGLRFGFSYDINVSSFNTVSQKRGGMEFSLIYVQGFRKTSGIPCPKF